jgi:hypothetical protein
VQGGDANGNVRPTARIRLLVRARGETPPRLFWLLACSLSAMPPPLRARGKALWLGTAATPGCAWAFVVCLAAPTLRRDLVRPLEPLAMQQYVLIAAGLALALGGLAAMFLSRPRPGDGPPPIADPYEELYSDLRGEVVARPLGEPHAGVNRQKLGDNGAPSVRPVRHGYR